MRCRYRPRWQWSALSINEVPIQTTMAEVWIINKWEVDKVWTINLMSLWYHRKTAQLRRLWEDGREKYIQSGLRSSTSDAGHSHPQVMPVTLIHKWGHSHPQVRPDTLIHKWGKTLSFTSGARDSHAQVGQDTLIHKWARHSYPQVGPDTLIRKWGETLSSTSGADRKSVV